MDLSAIFCLDRKREKRYHKPQVNHYCDEEEEYLRSICRELSVGVRQRCETEKGTLEQCHKRGLMRWHQSTRVEPRKILRASSLAEQRGDGSFLVSIRPLQDTLVVLSEIRQRLISYRVKGLIPLQGVWDSVPQK